jgi:hypothetical protein
LRGATARRPYTCTQCSDCRSPAHSAASARAGGPGRDTTASDCDGSRCCCPAAIDGQTLLGRLRVLQRAVRFCQHAHDEESTADVRIGLGRRGCQREHGSSARSWAGVPQWVAEQAHRLEGRQASQAPQVRQAVLHANRQGVTGEMGLSRGARLSLHAPRPVLTPLTSRRPAVLQGRDGHR